MSRDGHAIQRCLRGGEMFVVLHRRYKTLDGEKERKAGMRKADYLVIMTKELRSTTASVTSVRAKETYGERGCNI